jgi:predicted enzyme involved in methoxymalonyl-ACP biosynthesis
MLRGLIEQAQGLGATRLIGEYQPTPKNDVVAELYPKLGFVPGDPGFFARDITTPLDDLVTHIGQE